MVANTSTRYYRYTYYTHGVLFIFILCSSALVAAHPTHPQDDPTASTSSQNLNTLTKANIFSAFVTLQLCFLTQPRGSLIYPGRPVWLWRFNPLLCAYETLLIFYLLVLKGQGPFGADRRCTLKNKAASILYIRSLPSDVDKATIKRSLSPESIRRQTWSFLPWSWLVDLAGEAFIIGCLTETTIWSHFPVDRSSPYNSNLPDLSKPKRVGSPTESKIQIIGALGIISMAIKVFAVRGAPILTACAFVYILNWLSVLVLMILASRDVRDLEGSRHKEEREEDERQITRFSHAIMMHCREIRRPFGMDMLADFAWPYSLLTYWYFVSTWGELIFSQEGWFGIDLGLNVIDLVVGLLYFWLVGYIYFCHVDGGENGWRRPRASVQGLSYMFMLGFPPFSICYLRMTVGLFFILKLGYAGDMPVVPFLVMHWVVIVAIPFVLFYSFSFGLFCSEIPWEADARHVLLVGVPFAIFLSNWDDNLVVKPVWLDWLG
ncbi:hypothetical protein AA313_de0201355 [Arthrobotrys entomopaga]|nr:hypothetical protein AA313_de0201355 [Arthrobotrys entomopaga]